MNFYSQQSKISTAMAVVRQDVDQSLQYARFDGCYGELVSISQNGFSFNVQVTNCSNYIHPGKIERDIQSVTNTKFSVSVVG